MFDAGVYDELPQPDVAQDPLRFRDERRYVDRLKDARTKTGRQEAFAAARGTLSSAPAQVNNLLGKAGPVVAAIPSSSSVSHVRVRRITCLRRRPTPWGLSLTRLAAAAPGRALAAEGR